MCDTHQSPSHTRHAFTYTKVLPIDEEVWHVRVALPQPQLEFVMCGGVQSNILGREPHTKVVEHLTSSSSAHVLGVGHKSNLMEMLAALLGLSDCIDACDVDDDPPVPLLLINDVKRGEQVPSTRAEIMKV